MTFPSTPILADFSTMNDQTAPIVGFANPPGALNLGKMIVDGHLAQADSSDPDSPLGFALYDQVVGPNYEARVRLGPLDVEGYFGGLGIFNEAGTDGYLVMWSSDGTTTGLVVGTLGGTGLSSWGITNLTQGDEVGFQTRNNKLTVYLKYGSGSWRPLGVVSNLSLPATGRIGFGAIGVG